MTGAILLAGGRASRMGGAAKPQLEVGGRSLLQRAIDAVDGCRPITVAADPVDGVTGIDWVREDPPFGGPASAIVAALESWDDDPDWTIVLACDLPGADAAVSRLRRDLPLLPAETEGLCLADASSRPQWLTGIYRTAALRRGARALAAQGHGAPVRDLVADLAIAVVVAPEDETADVDTWEDLTRARARRGGPDDTTGREST